MNNPEALAFVNNQIRPLAELARAFRARVADAKIEWFGGINTLVPNTAETIDDGREAEGVSRLVGTDVNGLMSVLIGMADAGNDQIIEKPTVRPLQVA